MTPAVSPLRRLLELQSLAPGGAALAPAKQHEPTDTFQTGSSQRAVSATEGSPVVAGAALAADAILPPEAPPARAPNSPATSPGLSLSAPLEAPLNSGPTLSSVARAAGKGKGLGQLVKGLLRDNSLVPLREELTSVNRFEAMARSLTTPAAFAARTAELKARLAAGETLEQLRPEAYAVAREAAFQATGMRPHDCQVLGALAMDDGGIAQMATGEGKTLTAVMPLYLNALAGKGAHLITVNDTLARRDAEWMRPIFERLGLTLGCVLEDQSAEEKRRGYACDVTYLTDRALGFDFLRDRAATDPAQRVQRGLAFALIDEVDDVLIDEAGTPLILSRKGEAGSPDYALFSGIVKELVPGEDFQVNSEESSVWLTEGGMRYVDNELALGLARERAKTDPAVATELELGLRRRQAIRRENAAQKRLDDHLAGRPGLIKRLLEGGHDGQKETLESALREATQLRRELGSGFDLYAHENAGRVHFLDACLRARALFQPGKHYIVEGGEIKIIDQGKGRVGAGKRFGLGLHQALEAREGLKVRADSQTVGRVSLPELFSHYARKAGMSGTAMTSAEELRELYGLEVINIPTHRPSRRQDLPDVLFGTHAAKLERVVREAVDEAGKGRPVLIGTISVKSNKELAAALLAAGWPMDRLQILNAETVRGGEEVRDANAGRSGTITLASAGRERGLRCDAVNFKGIASRALSAVASGRPVLVCMECAEDARQVEGWLQGRVPAGAVTVRVGPGSGTGEVILAADFQVEPLLLSAANVQQDLPLAMQAYEAGRPVVVAADSTADLSLAAEAFLDSGVGLESLPMLCEGKEKEKVVIEAAGRSGFITVATNMAGRGADIKPDLIAVESLAQQAHQALQGGQPVTIAVEKPAQAERLRRLLSRVCPVRDDGMAVAGQLRIAVGEPPPEAPGLILKGADFPTGGLLVMGTERALSRRIDDQLVGRAGRQGAPGQSRFYLSLDDDLLRLFGADNLGSLLRAFDPRGEGVSSDVMAGLVKEAQQKVEGQHLESRLTAARYDSVSQDQRNAFYSLRERLVDGRENPREWSADFAATGLAEMLREELGEKKTYLPDEIAASLERLGLPAVLAPDVEVPAAALAAAMFPAVAQAFRNPELPEIPLREVVLGVVDDAWQTLQETMDRLGDGIHLVAFASSKPEDVYSQEGMKAFRAMKADIGATLATVVLPHLLTI